MALTKQLITLTCLIGSFMCKGISGRNGIINNNNQLNLCAILRPCLNDGQCSMDNGLIECSCADGFTGSHCNVDCNAPIENCPDGFEMYPPGSGKCYHFGPYIEMGTFLQAQKYCRDLHKHTSLFEPNDMAEFLNVTNNANGYERYWTGVFDVYDEGSLIYAGTGQSFPPQLINDSNEENKDCVYVRMLEGVWDFFYEDCGASFHPICELLNPCDLPEPPVLPVPSPPM